MCSSLEGYYSILSIQLKEHDKSAPTLKKLDKTQRLQVHSYYETVNLISGCWTDVSHKM